MRLASQFAALQRQEQAHRQNIPAPSTMIYGTAGAGAGAEAGPLIDILWEGFDELAWEWSSEGQSIYQDCTNLGPGLMCWWGQYTAAWADWNIWANARETWTWMPLETLQFARHFIVIFVETKRVVGSNINVILTQQTCRQRSSMVAGSKRQALKHYFSILICS